MFKKSALLLLIVLNFTLEAQQSFGNLNDYKYVIVPAKYSFFKEADAYQLNSLTKFLFEKYGFTAYMENEELPADYKKNVCLALHSNVLDDNGLFKTKLTVQLKNCEGTVIYVSKMGETREKEYKVAYQTALRDAFTSFESVDYKYVPTEKFNANESDLAQATTQQEIEKLKAEIEQLKAKEAETVAEETSEFKPVVGYPSPEAITDKVTESKPAVIPVQKETEKKDAKLEVSKDILYAQALNDGYQLVDSTPKVVYKLKKTGSDAMFLVESINGVLTKKGDNWVLEYYDNGNLVQKVLTIKF